MYICMSFLFAQNIIDCQTVIYQYSNKYIVHISNKDNDIGLFWPIISSLCHYTYKDNCIGLFLPVHAVLAGAAWFAGFAVRSESC